MGIVHSLFLLRNGSYQFILGHSANIVGGEGNEIIAKKELTIVQSYIFR